MNLGICCIDLLIILERLHHAMDYKTMVGIFTYPQNEAVLQINTTYPTGYMFCWICRDGLDG